MYNIWVTFSKNIFFEKERFIMQKKSIGLGGRGTILMLYQFFGFGVYAAMNQIGQNIYPMIHGGTLDSNSVALWYFLGSALAVIIQLIVGKKIANSGHLKGISITLMALAGGFSVAMAFTGNNKPLWLACWFIGVTLSIVGATFIISTMVGQWFPRRKGTVMGIATLAFPIFNAFVLTVFLGLYSNANIITSLGITPGSAAHELVAWAPFLLVDLICILLCAIFLKEFPEQCGCYPDNDKTMTPEAAHAMLAAMEEAKKKSVWTFGKAAKSWGFWVIAISTGILLIGSVGPMTQIIPILSSVGGEAFVVGTAPTTTGNIVLWVFAAVGCAGSWLIGILDTKVGTKKAIVLSLAIMIAATAILTVVALANPNCGMLPLSQGITMILFYIGFGCLQIFMGASSNFTVSAAAQYWRREDFPSVFAFVNAIANIINAAGPYLLTSLRSAAGKTIFGDTYTLAWAALLVLAIFSIIIMAAFKPSWVAKRDAKYRAEAGLAAEGVTKSASEQMGEAE